MLSHESTIIAVILHAQWAVAHCCINASSANHPAGASPAPQPVQSHSRNAEANQAYITSCWQSQPTVTSSYKHLHFALQYRDLSVRIALAARGFMAALTRILITIVNLCIKWLLIWPRTSVPNCTVGWQRHASEVTKQLFLGCCEAACRPEIKPAISRSSFQFPVAIATRQSDKIFKIFTNCNYKRHKYIRRIFGNVRSLPHLLLLFYSNKHIISLD